MEVSINFPHKVIVQVSRADNLLILQDRKGKKLCKWRVVVTDHKRKHLSEYATDTKGNPQWSYEATLKLNRTLLEPIVITVEDSGNNQVGQVVVPLVGIKAGGPGSVQTWQCAELEATRKCAQPTGNLYYHIWVEEYYPEEVMHSQLNGPKRHSIFGWRQDSKAAYEIGGGSQLNVSHSEKLKGPKRLSLFKSSDKSDQFKYKVGKAKSLANINCIETIEQSELSDSDLDKRPCFPPNNVYDNVTADLSWVRVGDVINENEMLRRESANTNAGELEKVEVWSVQPDNGPITGNFTVVMEGSNFSSGLFDLTYIIIDGVEPIDATTCTEIVSDTELVLTMPPVSRPGMVNINLELLDGSRINCSKTFHFIDPTIDDYQCDIFTPRNGEFPDLSSLDHVLDQYEDVLSSPIHEYKTKSANSSNDKVVLKRDSGMGSFNEKLNGVSKHRKLSDYGSQGSIFSERTSSVRRRTKQITMSKMELFEEVLILRKEVAGLHDQLQELASTTNTQITALKCQLESRDLEIDNISTSLCSLKVKLLEDGLTEYLELK